MKWILKISITLLLLVISLSSCLEEDLLEAKYAGAWKIDHYYLEGNDQTMSYLQSHADYLLHVGQLQVFQENWLQADGMHQVNGSWRISENRKNLVLNDAWNGERVYELKYYNTLEMKRGKEEWILRKF